MTILDETANFDAFLMLQIFQYIKLQHDWNDLHLLFDLHWWPNWVRNIR